jgi:hypothetical protein
VVHGDHGLTDGSAAGAEVDVAPAESEDLPVELRSWP